MRRSRKIFITLLLLLSLGGVWQIGLGAYIHAKAVLAQFLLEAAWSDSFNGHADVKPWPWADTWPVGRLTVPRLGISRIVLAGASGSALAFGPGFFSGTESTGNDRHVLIAGHRDTHFRFLRHLSIGDDIILQTQDGGRRRYRVAALEIINESDGYRIAASGARTLTLITCYPFDAVAPGGPLRYLVIAQQPSGTGVIL